MSNLKINETPVRTSKSFRINNIKIEDLEVPEKLEEKSIMIVGWNANCIVDAIKDADEMQ